MISRTQKELTEEDIARIEETYHVWRSGKGRESFSAGPQSSHLGSDKKDQQSSDSGAKSEKDSRPSLHGPYADQPCYCKSATTEQNMTPEEFQQAETNLDAIAEQLREWSGAETTTHRSLQTTRPVG